MKYSQYMKLYAKYGFLIISISFILLGVIRKEQLEVITKAAKICLECIGVG